MGGRAEPVETVADRDAPLRLDVAAKIAFPYGSMGVSGLRREIARGTLEAERIAGRLFVTLRGIDRMRELCRVQHSQPDSGSGPLPKTEMPFGSSSTEDASIALAAARMRVEKLKGSSGTTSQPNATQAWRRNVVPLKPA